MPVNNELYVLIEVRVLITFLSGKTKPEGRRPIDSYKINSEYELFQIPKLYYFGAHFFENA